MENVPLRGFSLVLARLSSERAFTGWRICWPQILALPRRVFLFLALSLPSFLCLAQESIPEGFQHHDPLVR